MSGQVLAAFITGVAFLVMLLAIACYMAFRTDPKPPPPQAMFIFRVVLALAAAGFGAVLPGFLEIQGTVLNLTLRAAGTLALFFVVYRVNPPSLVSDRLPKPKRPRRHTVPEQLIEKDKLDSENPK